VLGRDRSAYCGSRARCRRVLRTTLARAIRAASSAYRDDETCRDPGRMSPQACYDSILVRTLAGGAVERIPWIDRPTYQQAVSVQRRLPSPSPLCGPVRDVAPSRNVVEGQAPLVVGDSVLLGAIAEVTQAGFEVDAHACRKFREGLEVLRARAAAGTLPPLVVIALGSSGPVPRRDVQAALDTLGPNRRLALVTPNETNRLHTFDANVMREAARRAPGRVLLLDWVVRSAARPTWFQPDQIHLTPEGAAQFAALIATALT
jgi:hypothetical protein